MTVAFPPIAAAPLLAPAGIAVGTEVLTQMGARRVETLQVGDKIITRDRGFQALRWLGTALQSGGAIRFEAGAMGRHGAITLAPETRVLIRNPMVKVLFGETEVFALARDLVNGSSIRIAEGEPVQMVQLLFEHHEILRAAEMEVESLQPEGALMRLLNAKTQAEIMRILPTTTAGRGPAARPCLRQNEARMFSAAQ